MKYAYAALGILASLAIQTQCACTQPKVNLPPTPETPSPETSADAGTQDSGILDAGNDSGLVLDSGVDTDQDAGFDAGVTVEPIDAGPPTPPFVLSEVCYLRAVKTISALVEPDTLAGTRMAQGVVDSCEFYSEWELISHTDRSQVSSDGEPILEGENLILLAGGDFYHPVVDFLQDNEETPLTVTYLSSTERVSDRSGNVLLDIPYAAITPAHDFFLIQTVRSQDSLSHFVIIFGLLQKGTEVGVWYFNTNIMPNIENFTEEYYVYEWTDGNGDEIPNEQDDFSLLF